MTFTHLHNSSFTGKAWDWLINYKINLGVYIKMEFLICTADVHYSEMPVRIKSWNWLKYPEQLFLPILLHSTFRAKFPEIKKFPEDWHLII